MDGVNVPPSVPVAKTENRTEQKACMTDENVVSPSASTNFIKNERPAYIHIPTYILIAKAISVYVNFPLTRKT